MMQLENNSGVAIPAGWTLTWASGDGERLVSATDYLEPNGMVFSQTGANVTLHGAVALPGPNASGQSSITDICIAGTSPFVGT